MNTNFYRTTGAARGTTNLRRVLSLLAFVALLIATSLGASARPLPINIRLANPYQSCAPGFGLCVNSFQQAAGTAPSTAATMEVVRDIAKGPRAVVRIEFLGETPDGNEFTIAEDITLDRPTALAHRYQNITLKRGVYAVDRSQSRYGVVEVDAEVSGLTINIRFGLASRGCTGFGICSITIGLDAALAQGSAVLDGNTLAVDLFDGVEGSQSTITIDEDIELDNATSIALGAKRVKVLKGTYDVDRSTNRYGRVNLPVERYGITVTIDVGARSKGCTGFGICSITIDLNLLSANPAVVTSDGDMMTIDFMTNSPNRGNAFMLEEDVVIEGPVAIKLGYQKITLKAGSYDIDYSSNPNGSVNIPMTRLGVTIYVEVGRRSKGCTGFGICSITIDIDLRTPASGSLDGNTLALDFLRDVKSDDGTNTLVIDEDIVLDDATARALGAGHVTVLKGSYDIDRTTNPFGRVLLPVQRSGITINIEVGRRSRGCTGFGICSITIDIDLSLNVKPAVISMEGEQVSLNFAKPLGATDEPFVIEDDVVLDSRIALALGFQALTLPAGSYPVDYRNNPNGCILIPVKPKGTSLTIYIGRSWGNCRGFGICDIKLDFASSERAVRGSASINGTTMSLDLLGAAPDNGDVLEIDEDIMLDASTSRALGYRSVKIRKGSYPMNYRDNKNGHVDVNVETVGITIHVEIGRYSRNCYGFGICSITIGSDAAMNRPAPAVVVAGSNNISLEFMGVLPENGDTMYIDSDIELSSEVANALGGDRMTIKKGAYIVDRSENPFGSVMLATSDEGTASVGNNATGASKSIAMTVHPNPATSKATVSFNVDGTQSVRLALLDARGNVVRMLIDGERLAGGRHERNIDLTDLAAGAYFQRLTIGSTNVLTPMQVVR